MVTNPNIILSANQMAAPRLPDVNAMMQTRAAGMEKIYGIEQQRAEQARLEQERQEAAAAEAMLPSVMAAYKNPSDAGLDQAVSLMPAEVRDTFAPFVARLKAIPDPATRRAILESELAKDAGGRAVLERVMTPYQEGVLGIQRGQLELSKAELAQRRAEAEAEARRGNKMEYEYRDEIDAEGNPTGRVIAFPKYTYGEELPGARVVGAEAVGTAPIGTEVPPRVTAPGAAQGVRVAPAKTAKEEDLTEREGKSLNFALRMIDSDNIANELEQEGTLTTDAVSNFFLGAVRALPTVAGGNLAEQLESAFNAASPSMSPEEQRLARAQLDFVTAVLRSESGAEIKTSEFPAEYRKYFAVAGDEGNPKLLADKKRARQNAIKGMKAQAGKRGAREIDRIVGETGVTATPLTPGATLDGFEYQGTED